MGCKFSVVIPVFNAEKTINRCLDSLIEQKRNDTEIILINDGSKDRSAEICREYASKYECIIYREQENAGAASARNAGLEVASGEYITFVDSDDYVLDGYFDALSRSGDDFVVFSYQTTSSGGQSVYRFNQELANASENTEIILGVIKNRIAGPVNKRFKKSIIEEYGIRFKEDLIIGEDFVFGLEYMLLCNSSQVDPTVLYCVDETGTDSVTRAGRYDFTQSLRIYDYAFKIASGCSWGEDSKASLIQQLDYLFCRTAFAAAKRCINADSKNRMKARELICGFADQCCVDISPLNLVHSVMRLCIKHRVLPAFYVIAWLNRIASHK